MSTSRFFLPVRDVTYAAESARIVPGRNGMGPSLWRTRGRGVARPVGLRLFARFAFFATFFDSLQALFAALGAIRCAFNQL